MQRLKDDQGPILSIVEYRIDPTVATKFSPSCSRSATSACVAAPNAWNIFHDPDDPGRFVETSLVHSLLELKYRTARETKADELIEAQMDKFLGFRCKGLDLLHDVGNGSVRRHE